MACSVSPKSTILITGAARRIGAAIATAAATRGMNVIIHYNTSETEAENLAQSLTNNSVWAKTLQADLTKDSECGSLIDRAQTLCSGSLYLLVNNASVYPADSITQAAFDNFADSFRLNAYAPLCLSRAFAKSVQAGSIVNILDNRIYSGDPAHFSYMLSKQALASITLACALDFAPRIRVNGVAPGLSLPPAGHTGEYLDKLKHTIPLGAHVTPRNIADTVLFCAENKSLTGEIIVVDSGRQLLCR